MLIANSINSAWFSTLEEIFLPIGEKRLYNALIKYSEFKCIGDVIYALNNHSGYPGVGKVSMLRLERLFNILNIKKPTTWPYLKKEDFLNKQIICKINDYIIYKEADHTYIALVFKCSANNKIYATNKYLGSYLKLTDKAYFLDRLGNTLDYLSRDAIDLGISVDIKADFDLKKIHKIYTSLYKMENNIC